MNIFGIPSTGKSADWLMFVVMLAAIGLGIAIVAIWMFVNRTKTKKKRKRRSRHHRRHNPTLAQTGGLPPPREPGQPPPGV